jgi:hypothetical protein
MMFVSKYLPCFKRGIVHIRFTVLTQPNKCPETFLVYPPHQGHLVASLLVVSLIYAKSVDPKEIFKFSLLYMPSKLDQAIVTDSRQ